jgi:hypothetical protein
VNAQALNGVAAGSSALGITSSAPYGTASLLILIAASCRDILLLDLQGVPKLLIVSLVPYQFREAEANR